MYIPHGVDDPQDVLDKLLRKLASFVSSAYMHLKEAVYFYQ